MIGWSIISKSSAPDKFSLSDQRLDNPIGARENLVLEIIENAELGNVVLEEIFGYNEVVNMKDITGLSD